MNELPPLPLPFRNLRHRFHNDTKLPDRPFNLTVHMHRSYVIDELPVKARLDYLFRPSPQRGPYVEIHRARGVDGWRGGLLSAGVCLGANFGDGDDAVPRAEVVGDGEMRGAGCGGEGEGGGVVAVVKEVFEGHHVKGGATVGGEAGGDEINAAYADGTEAGQERGEVGEEEEKEGFGGDEHGGWLFLWLCPELADFSPRGAY